MADRYQDKPFSTERESDPLAELAKLIGQTDPFANVGRANQQAQPRSVERASYQPAAIEDDEPAAGPPPWMRSAAAAQAPVAAPEQEYPPSAVHPLRRYAAPPTAVPEPDYSEPSYSQPQRAPAAPTADPSRYDEALYGQLDASAQQPEHEPEYPEDPYSYRDEYEESVEEAPTRRGGGLMTVIAVVALAVLGTGAAFAYRTYVGSPRSGEPPIIKADTGPTKVIPAPADGTKVPDRMAAGDGTEKMVSREETPVDVNAKAAGPRVVLPQLNPNPNPPPVTSVVPAAPPATSANGTLSNTEPRKIKTLAVHSDPAAGAAASIGAPPKPAVTAAPRPLPTNANASASAPLSLSPQSSAAQPAAPAPMADPKTRIATTTNPTPIAPAGSPANSGGGSYLVQVSSQRNEADAQASFRSLQGKFPGVLGSRSPVIKRADLGDKGVYYRAMVGPFGSPDEASQFCGSLKSAGGQCVIQRN